MSSISYDQETWSNLIKGMSFGVLAPGISVIKTLYLKSSGAVGDRVVDISVQSRNVAAVPVLIASPVSPKSPALIADTGETLRTLVVPTVEPITASFNVSYCRSTKPQLGLADLSTYDEGYWDESDGGEATITAVWTCIGPHDIKVESLKLVKEVNGPQHWLQCS